MQTKEKISTYSKAYYVANREILLAKSKAYRDTHKEELAAKDRKEYFDNPEKKKEHCKKYLKKIRLTVLEHYGGKCMCCGEPTYEFLAIDHINGDGNKHRKQKGNGRLEIWIIKNNYPDNLQILCHNCNMAKSLYGKCPHQKGGEPEIITLPETNLTDPIILKLN